MRIGLVAGKSSEILTNELLSRGHQVYLVCGKSTDPGYSIATKSKEIFFTIDNSNIKVIEAVNFLLENNIDSFILGTGTWFTFQIAELLLGKGIRVSHNIEVAKLFKDKILTKKLFVENNLPTPAYFSFDTLNEDLISQVLLPKVVKSRIDLFPVFYCTNKNQLFNLLAKENQVNLNQGILFEDCIEGNDITIPVSATKSKITALDVIYWSKQHNYKLEGFNDLIPYRLNNKVEQELLNLCEKFIRQIGYFGLCRFDLRITDTSFYFLEINSVISIRNEGSSYQSMLKSGIVLEKIAIDTYLENLK